MKFLFELQFISGWSDVCRQERSEWLRFQRDAINANTVRADGDGRRKASRCWSNVPAGIRSKTFPWMTDHLLSCLKSRFIIRIHQKRCNDNLETYTIKTILFNFRNFPVFQSADVPRRARPGSPLHLRRNSERSSCLLSTKSPQADVLPAADDSNPWVGEQEADEVRLPVAGAEDRHGSHPLS